MSKIKLTVKNWQGLQHYKKRRPPWIKLHRELLDDYEYSNLTYASKALLIYIWLLASEGDDLNAGVIEMELNKMQFRVRMPEQDIVTSLKELNDKGFIELASNMLATCYQHAMPETETETEAETETEKKEGHASRDTENGFFDKEQSVTSKYYYYGKTVKLSHKDARTWRVRCNNLSEESFKQQLGLADDYYTENPPKNGKWFFPVSKWVTKANNEAKPKSPKEKTTKQIYYETFGQGFLP